MYRGFLVFFTVDTFFAFPGLWGRQGEVLFSLWGSTIENIILQSQEEFSPCWLSSKARSFLNSATSLPLDNQGQSVTRKCLAYAGAEDMYLTLTYLELDTFKQILPTYAPAALNSVKLGWMSHQRATL